MDENVVFNNTPGTDPNVGQNPSNASSQDAAGVVPNQAASADPSVQQANPQDTSTPLEQGAPDAAVQEAEVVPDGPPPRPGGGLLKKIIIGVVLLVIIIVGLFVFLPRGASNKDVKLVWWGLWEEQRVMEPLIEEFQKQHPNITVEYRKQDPKQYREKLTTRVKNGTGPDIFRFHNTWTPMISDLLLPLSTDVITPNEFKKTFYPVMQKDMTLNGAIYGIPLGSDTLGLFINTELFKAAGLEPPRTWDDFVEAAGNLTVKDENGKIQTAGAALGTYGNVTHAPDILSLLFIQQGIDIKKFSTIEEKKKTDVLEFYTAFAEGEENVWDGTLDESLVFFARGSLAMYIGYSWDIFRIRSINENLAFETYPVPQLVGRNAGVASYWAEGVSSQSKNKKEALLFMQYLTKKETAQKFYTEAAKTREFGELYARRDLADSLKENKLIYPFVQQLPNASSSYFASDTNDGEGGINSASNIYLGNAINSMINDNSSAQTVIETLNSGIDQVFQKYGVR
jgi:multiple sugar transport system substrate-binding protein